MSAASTLASLHTVSRTGVVAARWLRRPEAHRVIGAGSETVTTGGFGPSRLARRSGSPACLGLSASVLSLSGGRIASVGRLQSVDPRGSRPCERTAGAPKSSPRGRGTRWSDASTA